MFFKALVFQGPGFSESRFFKVQVFQGPGFSESRFLGSGSRVQVQDLGSRIRVEVQGPESGSRVLVQGLGPGYRSSLIQKGEVILKKNPTVGLPEVSKLTESAISKRQGDQRKHSFLEKKILHKRENGFTANTQKYHIT